MLDILEALASTSLPVILASLGAVFVFLSIGGKLGSQIITSNLKKNHASMIGYGLLLAGMILFGLQVKKEPQTAAEELTAAIPDNGKTTVNKTATYQLYQVLPLNKPFQNIVDTEYDLKASDKSLDCHVLRHEENTLTVLGHTSSSEPAAIKKKITSSFYENTCKQAGQTEPVYSKTHSSLEGVELLAHQTPEGRWVFDKIPGETAEQRQELEYSGFIPPYLGYPKENVPVGHVMEFKDADIGILLGNAFPGSVKGFATVKLTDVTRAVAQLKGSFEVASATMMDNTNVNVTISGKYWETFSISQELPLQSESILEGIISIAAPNNKEGVISGPIKVNSTSKEL